MTSKKFLTLAAAAAIALTASAARADIQASQPGDAKLSCKQLVAQIAEMDQIIDGAKASKTKSKITSAGFTLLQTVAPHLGIGGGSAAGTLGALQATGAASGIAESSAQDSQLTIEQAQTRRVALNGIYTGKGCTNGPEEAKAEDTKATTSKTASAATAPAQKSTLNK